MTKKKKTPKAKTADQIYEELATEIVETVDKLNELFRFGYANKDMSVVFGQSSKDGELPMRLKVWVYKKTHSTPLLTWTPVETKKYEIVMEYEEKKTPKKNKFSRAR